MKSPFWTSRWGSAPVWSQRFSSEFWFWLQFFSGLKVVMVTYFCPGTNLTLAEADLCLLVCLSFCVATVWVMKVKRNLFAVCEGAGLR